MRDLRVWYNSPQLSTTSVNRNACDEAGTTRVLDLQGVTGQDSDEQVTCRTWSGSLVALDPGSPSSMGRESGIRSLCLRDEACTVQLEFIEAAGVVSCSDYWIGIPFRGAESGRERPDVCFSLPEGVTRWTGI